MTMQTRRAQTQTGRSSSSTHEGHGSQTAVSTSQGVLYHHRPELDHDVHDDGLVHGHFWAMSSTVR